MYAQVVCFFWSLPCFGR